MEEAHLNGKCACMLSYDTAPGVMLDLVVLLAAGGQGELCSTTDGGKAAGPTALGPWHGWVGRDYCSSQASCLTPVIPKGTRN